MTHPIDNIDMPIRLRRALMSEGCATLEDAVAKHTADGWLRVPEVGCSTLLSLARILGAAGLRLRQRQHGSGMPVLTTVTRDLYYHEAAYVSGLETALRNIAGGCFDGAGSMVINGDWKAMYLELQQLARNALTTEKENSNG